MYYSYSVTDSDFLRRLTKVSVSFYHLDASKIPLLDDENNDISPIISEQFDAVLFIGYHSNSKSFYKHPKEN